MNAQEAKTKTDARVLEIIDEADEVAESIFNNLFYDLIIKEVNRGSYQLYFDVDKLDIDSYTLSKLEEIVLENGYKVHKGRWPSDPWEVTWL